jgi:CMP-N-acetylneuraminic acid synthetase
MTHKEMLEGISVIIPARANSRRVPEKNFIPFCNDESLLDIKINQLKDAGIPVEHITVSCEDGTKEECITRHGANFSLRNHYHTTPEGEKNLFNVMVDTAPVYDLPDDVLYISVTDPFFTEFNKLLLVWAKRREQHDSAIVVRKLGDQVLDGVGEPLNFDYFGQPSQCLKSWYTISMCAIVTKRTTVAKVDHYIGNSPYTFVTRDRGVDVDTADDFRLASLMWEASLGKV